MKGRRVVITGIGMVTPIGNDVDSSWSAMLAGTSGGARIQAFDTSRFASRIGAEIKGFDVTKYLDRKQARKVDKFIQIGMAAGIQAIDDAGIADAPDKHRIGVAIGSGIGGILSIEHTHHTVLESGPRRVSPFFVPSAIINMCAGNLSIMYGFTGANIAIATACSTGVHNIGVGARMIQYGDADAMVAGGAEHATSLVTLGGFSSMRALTTRNDDPEHASRPWDRDRDGFLLGDGAGAVVIEEFEHARRRGARIYCEVTGLGMSADAYHITGPPDKGDGAVASMRSALADADCSPDDIHYINAHGTSTPQGDVAETRAIKTVFGTDTEVLVSSTKSMIGHLLGAAGAVETIVCLLAMRDQAVPPTINLVNPGEGCDLDYVPNEARQASVNAVLCNSFGFGGTNASLILTRV